MRNCRKCGNRIPCRVRIGQKRYGLVKRKYCLKCSPFKQHNTRKLERPNANDRTPRRSFTCATCKKSRFERTAGMKCAACKARDRRHDYKQRAVNMLGSKCQICGYARCLSALTFHHKDGSKKDAALSVIFNCSWETVENELHKCVLLCCRCHEELHAGLIVMPE